MSNDNNLKVKLVNRTDTKENWSSTNPVLLEGEFGIEKENNKISGFKIGDGKTAWNESEYIKTGSKIVKITPDNEYYEVDPDDDIIVFEANLDDLLQHEEQILPNIILPKTVSVGKTYRFINKISGIYKLLKQGQYTYEDSKDISTPIYNMFTYGKGFLLKGGNYAFYVGVPITVNEMMMDIECVRITEDGHAIWDIKNVEDVITYKQRDSYMPNHTTNVTLYWQYGIGWGNELTFYKVWSLPLNFTDSSGETYKFPAGQSLLIKLKDIIPTQYRSTLMKGSPIGAWNTIMITKVKKAHHSSPADLLKNKLKITRKETLDTFILSNSRPRVSHEFRIIDVIDLDAVKTQKEPGTVVFDLAENPQPTYEVKPGDKVLKFINSNENLLDENKGYGGNEIMEFIESAVDSFANIHVHEALEGITVINDTELCPVHFPAYIKKFSYIPAKNGVPESFKCLEIKDYLYLHYIPKQIKNIDDYASDIKGKYVKISLHSNIVDTKSIAETGTIIMNHTGTIYANEQNLGAEFLQNFMPPFILRNGWSILNLSNVFYSDTDSLVMFDVAKSGLVEATPNLIFNLTPGNLNEIEFRTAEISEYINSFKKNEITAEKLKALLDKPAGSGGSGNNIVKLTPSDKYYEVKPDDNIIEFTCNFTETQTGTVPLIKLPEPTPELVGKTYHFVNKGDRLASLDEQNFSKQHAKRLSQPLYNIFIGNTAGAFYKKTTQFFQSVMPVLSDTLSFDITYTSNVVIETLEKINLQLWSISNVESVIPDLQKTYLSSLVGGEHTNMPYAAGFTCEKEFVTDKAAGQDLTCIYAADKESKTHKFSSDKHLSIKFRNTSHISEYAPEEMRDYPFDNMPNVWFVNMVVNKIKDEDNRLEIIKNLTYDEIINNIMDSDGNLYFYHQYEPVEEIDLDNVNSSGGSASISQEQIDAIKQYEENAKHFTDQAEKHAEDAKNYFDKIQDIKTQVDSATEKTESNAERAEKCMEETKHFMDNADSAVEKSKDFMEEASGIFNKVQEIKTQVDSAAESAKASAQQMQNLVNTENDAIETVLPYLTAFRNSGMSPEDLVALLAKVRDMK